MRNWKTNRVSRSPPSPKWGTDGGGGGGLSGDFLRHLSPFSEMHCEGIGRKKGPTEVGPVESANSDGVTRQTVDLMR